MKLIDVEISGVTPMLMSKPPDDLGMEKPNRGVSSGPGDAKPRDIAAKALYVKPGTNGDAGPGKEEVVIPSTWILGSIMNGGMFEKVGRSKVTTTRKSLIPAAVYITEEYVDLIQAEDTWQVDSRPVTIPATGGRVMRHRPKFERGWKARFTLQIDEDVLAESMVRRCIDHAGSKVGMGDFRPDRRGPFGRFVVTHWGDAPDEE
jgi:hypothetical protein